MKKSKKKNANKGKSSKKKKTQVAVLPASVRMQTSINNGPQRVPSGMVETVCSIVDPFCTKARGAKWFDGMGESTIPFQVRGHISGVAVTGGGAIYGFTPGVSTTYFYQASLIGGTYTWGAAYGGAPGVGFIVTNCSAYRVVTAGLIIRNVLPALTAGGYIIVTRVPKLALLGATQAAGNVYAVEVATHPIVSGMEIPVLFRPLGSSSRSFTAFEPLNTTYPGGQFDAIQIEMVGAPVGVCLDFEIVYNIECLVNEVNASLLQLVPVTAPSNPLVVSMANQASAALSDLTYTSVKAIGSSALKWIGSRLMSAMHPGPKLLGAGMYSAATLVD